MGLWESCKHAFVVVEVRKETAEFGTKTVEVKQYAVICVNCGTEFQPVVAELP